MDSIFFYLSKIIWLIISPDSLLLIFLTIGVFFLWRKKYVWGKGVLTSVLILLMLIGMLPIGEWLLYPLESKYPPNPELKEVDGIILLGGAEDAERSYLWQQPVLGNATERYFALITLVKKFPNARVVFTGGSGRLAMQAYKEADVAKQLFIQQGLDVSKFIFEDNARNTWENATFSKKLGKPIDGEKWVLITTGWHMPRAVGVFQKQGWEVTPYPVVFASKPNRLLRLEWNFSKHLNNLNIAAKQWIGLIAYKFTGKIA